jgi:hypothetical protein
MIVLGEKKMLPKWSKLFEFKLQCELFLKNIILLHLGFIKGLLQGPFNGHPPSTKKLQHDFFGSKPIFSWFCVANPEIIGD